MKKPDLYLGYSGLELSFEFEGVEYTADLDVEDAIDLLLSAGMLDSYIDGMLKIDGYLYAWEDYVDSMKFTVSAKRAIARAWMAKQTCKRIMEPLKKAI